MATPRILRTVLFTDIVGSTQKAATLKDAAWSDLLRLHHAVVEREVDRRGGQIAGSTGDGTVAVFDGPTPAILAALSIRDALRELDLEIRAGIHMGEVIRSATDIQGIGVHIGARVAAEAAPGEVLVSSTVHDAEAGSDLHFADRGRHTLKGVPGEWHRDRAIEAWSWVRDGWREADPELQPRVSEAEREIERLRRTSS